MELDPSVAASAPEQLGARESTAGAVSVHRGSATMSWRHAPKGDALFLALEHRERAIT